MPQLREKDENSKYEGLKALMLLDDLQSMIKIDKQVAVAAVSQVWLLLLFSLSSTHLWQGLFSLVV